MVPGEVSPVTDIGRGTRIEFTVDCPTGMAIGGGARIVPDRSNTSNADDLVLQSTFPLDTDTWEAEVVALRNIGGVNSAFTVTPYVICG